jgi:hypothetical protein
MPARYADASNKVFPTGLVPPHTPVVKARATNEVSKVPNKQRLTQKSATTAIFSEMASWELGKERRHTKNENQITKYEKPYAGKPIE